MQEQIFNKELDVEHMKQELEQAKLQMIFHENDHLCFDTMGRGKHFIINIFDSIFLQILDVCITSYGFL